VKHRPRTFLIRPSVATCRSLSPAVRADERSRYSPQINVRALLLTLVLAATTAAATPPPPPIPTVPLHTEFVVEVNAKGQVVRVKSAKASSDKFFNTQTNGNVLQMWIRHPDGSAEVGLYRVWYDFDPKTQKISRNFAIVSRGGNWANEPGAATVMMQTAQHEAEEAQQRQQGQQNNLPPLEGIIGATPSPTPTRHP
jgi:hypothetical protein